MAETFVDGETVNGVARRHNISRSMLFGWRKQYRESPTWILARSATGSREADLGVFAELFEDRLEGRLEAETFSRREIGGYDAVTHENQVPKERQWRSG